MQVNHMIKKMSNFNELVREILTVKIRYQNGVD
jgi:hypothetical protein